MSADPAWDDERKQPRYQFDRHTPEYQHRFEAITQEMQANCPGVVGHARRALRRGRQP